MLRIGLLYPTPDPLSPTNWSGTPLGLARGLEQAGVEVVPIGARLPIGLHQTVAVLSRATGKRGAVADRTWVRYAARTVVLQRACCSSPPLDGLVVMGLEMFDLARVRPRSVPVATYDDGTLQQMWAHPDSDISSSDFPEREVRRWFGWQSRSARAADMCCVSTNYAAQSFIRDYGVSSQRVQVVGMGHRSRSSRAAARRNWSTPKFLFVGLDWDRKNGEIVLRAFEHMRALNPSATLDLVGRHRVVRQEGVRDHGLLDRRNASHQALLDRLYAEATCFILPSKYDLSPVSYLEAASAGLPVIASAIGGGGEVLGDAAHVVDPKDELAIFGAMQTLANPQMARELGERAAKVASSATWRHVAERLLGAINLVPPNSRSLLVSRP